jgi:hypothetical protein
VPESMVKRHNNGGRDGETDTILALNRQHEHSGAINHLSKQKQLPIKQPSKVRKSNGIVQYTLVNIFDWNSGFTIG